MEELKQNEQIQTPKTKKTDEFHLKQITIIALAIFITFCCCILFFFVIYRYNGFTDFWKKLTYILQPVIIGLVVAYLLNPLMKLIDGKVIFPMFKGKMKSEKKAKKISRGMAIAGALLFLVGIIVLLIAAIVPSIIQSIQGIISTLPAEVRSLVDWINDIAKGGQPDSGHCGRSNHTAVTSLKTGGKTRCFHRQKSISLPLPAE